MSRVVPVDGNIHMSPRFFSIWHIYSEVRHELRVPDRDRPTVDLCRHPLSAVVRGLGTLGAGGHSTVGADGPRDRVSGEGLRFSGKFDHFLFGHSLRAFDPPDGEIPLGERSGLVEHSGTCLRHRLDIVAPFDQYALSRSVSYSAEVGQRNGHHESAGTGHHQERQRDDEPVGEIRRPDERRDNCNGKCQTDDRRGVIPGESGYEFFGGCLSGSGVLDKCQHLARSRILVMTERGHLDGRIGVQVSAEDLVAFPRLAGDRLSGHGLGVNERLSADDDAVHRDQFSGFHDDGVADLNRLGLQSHDLVVADHRGIRCLEVHQCFDGRTGLADGTALEILPDLVEHHHCDGFAPVCIVTDHTDRECSEGGDHHQEVLVEESRFGEIPEGTYDDVVTDDQKSAEEYTQKDDFIYFDIKHVLQKKSEDHEDETGRDTDGHMVVFFFFGLLFGVRPHLPAALDPPGGGVYEGFQFRQFDIIEFLGLHGESLVHENELRLDDVLESVQCLLDLPGTVGAVDLHTVGLLPGTFGHRIFDKTHLPLVLDLPCCGVDELLECGIFLIWNIRIDLHFLVYEDDLRILDPGESVQCLLDLPGTVGAVYLDLVGVGHLILP